MTFARLMLLVLAVHIVPSALSAQNATPSKPIELGIDGALAYESSDRIDATTITLPVSRFRVGFFVSDAVSIEPSLSLQYSRVTIENPLTGEDRTTSGTSYDVDFGLLYHFSPDRMRAQTFIRPFLGLRGFNADEASASQVRLGAAVGIRKPLTNRLGARFELGYSHNAEDEDELPSSDRLFLSFGFSFFTH